MAAYMQGYAFLPEIAIYIWLEFQVIKIGVSKCVFVKCSHIIYVVICLPLIAGFFRQKDYEVHPSLKEQEVELFLTDSLLTQVPK